ncbi:MAG: SIMPL domain-containing protein [Oscillospiraceae bacterium]|nr:SIMPL domain-containing protein [Oscillospiraceae bacterium]
MKISKANVLLGVFVAALLVVCLALAISLTNRHASPMAFAQTPTRAEQAPSITVTGIGEIAAVPDIATASFTVITTDVEPEEALAQNNIITERVIEAILARDVDEADVQTRNFSIHPNYSWTETYGSVVVDHSAYNSLHVTIRDIDRVGEILGAATEAGATSVSSVRFSLDDTTEAYDQALTLAIESAAAKAESMARAAGHSIVSVLSITEAARWDMPTVRDVYIGTVMDESAEMESDFDVPVQPGEVSVRAQVEIIYAIR